MSDESGSCFELPRVFATMLATNPDIGKVSHKFRYNGVVVTTHHCLETSLRVRIESRPLVLGEDSSTQWVFEFDSESRVLLVTV